MPDFERLAHQHLLRNLRVAELAGDDQWAQQVRDELETHGPAAALEPEPEQRDDGVYAVGGGWHEVVVAGEVVDKVRGADAAQEAYEAHQEGHDGDDQLP